MKNEDKPVHRSKVQDGLPHDLAVLAAKTAVVTATSMSIKAAIEEIRGRLIEKPKPLGHKSGLIKQDLSSGMG
jgi:hypothetical protein